MHPTAADGGLRGHVPARPEYITPHIRFLFIVPQFGLGFLQTPPRGDALALLLAFGSAKPGRRTCTYEVTRHARRTRSVSRQSMTTGTRNWRHLVDKDRVAVDNIKTIS